MKQNKQPKTSFTFREEREARVVYDRLHHHSSSTNIRENIKRNFNVIYMNTYVDPKLLHDITVFDKNYDLLRFAIALAGGNIDGILRDIYSEPPHVILKFKELLLDKLYDTLKNDCENMDIAPYLSIDIWHASTPRRCHNINIKHRRRVLDSGD